MVALQTIASGDISRVFHEARHICRASGIWELDSATAEMWSCRPVSRWLEIVGKAEFVNDE